ncbi:MAG: Crp/Fnr family transcriptional regulator [Mucilaginibacter sp.]|uniref:Crp/Fnr family transcriptional regulator n=1 Tax=Mucilaginibacter sp. TaxID=1882438 RepID=UPI0031B1BA1B
MMSEFQPLIEHVKKRVDMTDDELAELLSYFSIKKIKKKQYIIQPDFVAKHRNYVIEGAFRAYVIDEKGEEHTIQFAIEDWWISDYNSFIYQQPATMFVVALDDSVVLQITHEQEQKLKAAAHQFETFFRIMAERSAAFQQRRIISNLTQSAEERYTDFLEKYPLVAQRVPQYALASYLGMTTEFLSKIRNNKVRRKS